MNTQSCFVRRLLLILVPVICPNYLFQLILSLFLLFRRILRFGTYPIVSFGFPHHNNVYDDDGNFIQSGRKDSSHSLHIASNVWNIWETARATVHILIYWCVRIFNRFRLVLCVVFGLPSLDENLYEKSTQLVGIKACRVELNF